MADMKAIGVVKPLPLALAAVLLVSGCSHSNPQPAQQSNPAPNQPGQQAINPGTGVPAQQSQAQQQPAPYPQQTQRAPYPQQAPSQQAPAANYAPAPRPVSVIPAGTHLVVTLRQTLSSKTSQTGDSFSATVADPVVVRGVTLIRAGSPASGTVTDAKGQGHFKGQAELAIRLDTIRAEGHSYQIASSTVERVEKGKGKRTAVLTGGGAGLGGLIGGLAGGGKGLLIGGLAGAGAGATGSAFTGNKDLVIPAETRLTFRVEHEVRVD